MNTQSLKDTMKSMHNEQVLTICKEIRAYENILETMRYTSMVEKKMVYDVIINNLARSKSKLLDLRLLEGEQGETTGFSRCSSADDVDC